MKRSLIPWLVLLLAPASMPAAEDWLDPFDDALTIGSSDGFFRARLSGTLDLEGYRFSQPAPGFIDADGAGLFNPRLSTFLDAQLGARVYAFAQTRVDRGFDPAADPLRARVDEFAVRVTPWLDGRFSVQLGKFATVVGNWVPRHGSWDNPFVSAPLPYENLTGVWDAAAAGSGAMLLAWAHVRPPSAPHAPAADKYLRLPVIWGPSYAPGVAVSGELGRLDYAAELKSAALAARPDSWDFRSLRWPHPTVSGRLGYRPDPTWSFGASASLGSYLVPPAAATLPAGAGLGDYREVVLGQDLGFAWHHFQLWAEIFGARFEIPRVGTARTWAYYVEARYKFTPQFFCALRWNAQVFGRIPDGFGGSARWGADVWRVDLAPGYRLTPHTQFKLQLSLQHPAPGQRAYAAELAGQFVVRF